jgi:hypothetical protein
LLAEVVLGESGAELISTEIQFTGQEREIFGRDAMMKYSLLPANRAIAFCNAIDAGFDLEAHGSAMTTAGVVRHLRSAL